MRVYLGPKPDDSEISKCLCLVGYTPVRPEAPISLYSKPKEPKGTSLAWFDYDNPNEALAAKIGVEKSLRWYDIPDLEGAAAAKKAFEKSQASIPAGTTLQVVVEYRTWRVRAEEAMTVWLGWRLGVQSLYWVRSPSDHVHHLELGSAGQSPVAARAKGVYLDGDDWVIWG